MESNVTKDGIRGLTDVSRLQQIAISLLTRTEDLKLEVDSARGQMGAFQEMINQLLAEKEKAMLGNNDSSQIDALIREKEECEMKIGQLKAELDQSRDLKSKLEASEFERESLELMVTSLKQEIQGSGVQEHDTTEFEKALKDKEEEIQVMIAAFEEDKENWTNEIDALKKQVQETRDENQALLNAFDEDRAQFEATIKSLRNELSMKKENDSCDSLNKANADLKRDLESRNAEVEDLQRKLTKQENELKQMKETITELNRTDNELPKLQEQLETQEKECFNLKATLERTQSELTAKNEEIATLRQKNTDNDALLANLQSDKRFLELRLEELNHNNETLSDSQAKELDQAKSLLSEKEVVVDKLKESVASLEQQLRKAHELNENLRAESQAKSLEFTHTISQLEQKISGCETLEQEIGDLKEKTIEVERLRSRKQELELELSELRSSQQKQVHILSENLEEQKKKSDELEANLRRAEEKNKELNARISEQATQASRQIKELQMQIDDQKFDSLTNENKLLGEQVRTMQAQVADLINERDTLKKDKLQLEHSIAELEQANLSQENTEEIDKDAAISRLKSLLERAAKQDQLKQKRIDELQAILSTHQAPSENITRHQSLVLPRTSTDADRKIEKLNKMLETSSRLYAELSAEHQTLKSKLETLSKSKERSFSIHVHKNLFIAPENKVPVETPTQPPVEERPNPENENVILNAYLRRTVLQFFLQDDSKRDAMIPMILELVGCNEQQITTAQRQWARSRQFFKTGLFGWGK